MDLEDLAVRMQTGFASLHLELAEVKHTAEQARDQAVETNGRVTKLEMWRVYLDGVRHGAGGLWQYAIAVTGFALVLVQLYVLLSGR